MSNYSDYQKKGKSQGDSRYNKRPQGESYNNRDSRTSDKKYPDSSNSYKGYNSGSYNDSYQSKGGRTYNQNSFKPRPHYPRNTYEEQHDVSQYRRKVTRYTKNDLLEAFEDSATIPNLRDLIGANEALFTDYRQDPVNDEEFKLDPNDAFAPPRINEAIPKKEEIVSDNKFQLYDLGNQGFDPIADLKKQRQIKKEIEGDQEEEEDDFGGYQGRNDYEEEQFAEGDRDNFSDIDAKFEQKLRSNQYHITEDVFDELLGGQKKVFDIGELENDQRPDWEDEKVSTTIVEKDKDFFNQNPQFDKRFLPNTGGFQQNSKQKAVEEHKQEPVNIQTQLQIFQQQIQKQQQQEQSTQKQVQQQPTQQKAQPLLLQQQLMQQLQVNQQPQPQVSLQQQLIQQLNVNQQPQPQPQIQPQQTKKVESSNGVDFSKLTFESDLRYDDHFNTRQDDDIISAAFSQFSNQGYSDSYESDISSFVKSLSVGVPTTFRTTSFLSKANSEVKPEPKPIIPEFTQNTQLTQVKKEVPKDANHNVLGGPKKRPMPMYPSFVFRYYSADYDQPNWWYIDSEEKKLGPFSGKHMDQYYADGTYPLDLKVTIGENNQYKTIKEIADFIVAKTINGDGPPPEKKAKPQNEMISKLVEQLGNKDLPSSGDHPPLKAKTLDEIEVPVNYEKWAPPMIKTEKKKDEKGHHNKNYNNKNYHNNHNNNNNEQGHNNNYKKNYQNQNNRQNNQNYNQNYQNQGNYEQNYNNYNRNNAQRMGGNMANNLNNQNNQPLIATNNLNIANPNDQAQQLKGLLGMIKPEIKTQQTQIHVNQVPKIDNADFPSLGETYMNK